MLLLEQAFHWQFQSTSVIYCTLSISILSSDCNLCAQPCMQEGMIAHLAQLQAASEQVAPAGISAPPGLRQASAHRRRQVRLLAAHLMHRDNFDHSTAS